MSGDFEDLYDFIGSRSIGIVEEHTHLNHLAFNDKMGKVYLFFDPTYVTKTEQAVQNFKHIAVSIGKKYNYLIGDGRDNKRLMVSLDLNGCELPCIGFKPPVSDPRAYRYDNEFLGNSVYNVTKFLEKYENNGLTSSREKVDRMWEGINKYEQIVENMTLTYSGLKTEVFRNDTQKYDFLLYLYNSTDINKTHNLKVMNYTENFIQLRLGHQDLQVMAYDFGLNKLPVKFSRHPKWDYQDFFCFVSAENKQDIIVLEDESNRRDVAALDLIHFAMINADRKLKIPKDFMIGEVDTEYGVSLIGLLEGKEAHDLEKKKKVLSKGA